MFRKLQKYDFALLVGAFVTFILLIYYVRESVTPIVAFTVLILFLLPLRSQPIVKYIILVSVFLFAIWFIGETKEIITPFAISLGLAYLFDPLVQKMEQIKIPRWLGVFIIVLFVLAVVAVILIFLIPKIIHELGDLVAASVQYSRKLSTWIESGWLRIRNYVEIDYNKIQDFALNELPGRIQKLFQTIFKSVTSVSSALSTALGQLLNLVLVPFLFYYLLKDFSRIKRWFKNLLPQDTGWVIQEYILQIDKIISGFFRGQLIVCLIVGTLTSLGLLIFDIKYALLLGIMAGILNIIPYIGLAITLAFGLLIGLFSADPFLTCIKIIGVIEAVQILESSFLSPRIVGDSVGLHPAWVIFAILIFSHFWGFLGLIVAVPTAAGMKIFISIALEQFRQKRMKQIE